MDIDNLISGAVGESLQDTKKPLDQAKKSTLKAEKRGRKNRGLTSEHYEIKKQDRKDFRAVKQGDNFNIEKCSCEVVGDSTAEFAELYKLTCYSCLDSFLVENSELSKKPPFIWYKRVLLDIKKNTPKISYKDLDKCVAVWDILADFMDYIGLYITYETFEKVTSIYKYQLEKMAELSPLYKDFIQKINIERDSALLNELQYNPYNQTNKIFIAKSHGIVEKTDTKTIEVNHNIRNYDSLPMFSSDFLEDHQQNNI